MGANQLKSTLRGPNNILFKDGQYIRFKTPSFKLGGTVMGDRTIDSVGNVIVEDLTNNYKAVLIMSTFQSKGFFNKKVSGKKDDFVGLIYESTPLDIDHTF